MKAKQLKIEDVRIGNRVNAYVFNENDDDVLEQVIVTGLQPQGEIEWWYEGGDHEEYGGAYGIPLSPEWLERFGFVELGAAWCLINVSPILTNFNIRQPNNDDVWVLDLCDGKALATITTFKYVHQLENLYSALTGEELNIEL